MLPPRSIWIVHVVILMHHKHKQFIWDLYIIMATPLIPTFERQNKGCVLVFCLSSRSFTGFNIAPGQNIPCIEEADKYQDIIFLTYKNHEKRLKGRICAASDVKFKNLPPDEYFPCSLILLQGLYFS